MVVESQRKIHYNKDWNIAFSTISKTVTVVAKENPLQQGLKQKYTVFFEIEKLVAKENPLQQGLKLLLCY